MKVAKTNEKFSLVDDDGNTILKELSKDEVIEIQNYLIKMG